MLGIFCEMCRAELVEYGSPAVLVYDLICEHYLIYKQAPVFRQKDVKGELWSKMVDLLERKGILVSTEVDQVCMRVKPLGVSCIAQEEDCECFICFDPAKHTY